MRTPTFALFASALVLASAAVSPAAVPVYEFGPSASYVEKNTRFAATNGQEMGWGGKRLFSESTPLTPPGLTPAVHGGYELYNIEGGKGIFVDYSGSPTTGVNNNAFAGQTLDSLGVKSGYTVDGEPRSLSFALAFLALGRMDKPVPLGPGFAVTVRLNNRQIGDVPGSVRVIIRAGGAFYASRHWKPLRSTADTTLIFTAAELKEAGWSRYEPTFSLAYDADAEASLPSSAGFDFAGVLVTRVVNAFNRTKPDFATVEIAELRVLADRR